MSGTAVHGERSGLLNRTGERLSLSTASLAAKPSSSSRRLASSDGLGWQSVGASVYAVPDQTEWMTTAATSDLLISLNVGGAFAVESRRAGILERARSLPDSIGMTAPGHTASLRWRSELPGRKQLLHTYLSVELLQQTAQNLRRPHLMSGLPDALLLEDPVGAAHGRALLKAVQLRADPLHAEALAQSLALYLVYGRTLATASTLLPNPSSALSLNALHRVVEYMHANLAESIVLEDLSMVAAVSKFHFVRMFKLVTGEPPHHYLTGLRMHHAGELLRGSGDTVAQVARACGYSSPGRFANMFRRYYGVNPTQYRRAGPQR